MGESGRQKFNPCNPSGRSRCDCNLIPASRSSSKPIAGPSMRRPGNIASRPGSRRRSTACGELSSSRAARNCHLLLRHIAWRVGPSWPVPKARRSPARPAIRSASPGRSRGAISARFGIRGRQCAGRAQRQAGGDAFWAAFSGGNRAALGDNNRLTIEVTNVAANRIRDLDRRKVKWKIFKDINFVDINYRPFDASKWPVRKAGLLGPVTLTPLAE